MSEELAPSSDAAIAKTLQAWRYVVSCVAILCGLVLQILRAPLLSFVASPAYKLLANFEASGGSVEGGAAGEEEKGERLLVVLDMDETLICAYESSCLPSTVKSQATEAGLKCFDLDCSSSEKDADGKQKISRITVFERPGLHEFLRQCDDFADLVLFTAGLEGYANPVVDRIDIDKKLTRRLYRQSTVSTQHREHVKDLFCLTKDLSRVVIVDNNPYSFLLQPLNGIPCVPFSAMQPSDDQLLGVILPLLKHLSDQKDVRPVLYEKFHMPEWFKQHGIPDINCPS